MTIPENAITVGPRKRVNENGHVVVSAPISVGAREREVWYRAPESAVGDEADPFLAASLPIAMRMGGCLHVAGFVSAALLNAVSTIQDIYHSWNPCRRTIRVEATPRPDPPPSFGRDNALFFSGRADSFYTLLKRRNEMGALIFMHGFDIPLHQAPLRRRASAEVRRVASALGKRVVEVETNLRDVALCYVPWVSPGDSCVGPAFPPEFGSSIEGLHGRWAHLLRSLPDEAFERAYYCPRERRGRGENLVAAQVADAPQE